jgi:Flp pilus assembly protein TadB
MNAGKVLLLAGAVTLFVAVLTTSMRSVWVALLFLAGRASIAMYTLAKRRRA